MINPRDRSITRRTFMKGSALGAASMGMAPLIHIPGPPDLSDGGFDYHPRMNPFRVVGIENPRMTKEINADAPWKVQDGLVDPSVTGESIDRLACALAGEKGIKDAWKRIFTKPAKKSWKDVVVAVKTNNIGQQHTRSAVMSKICRVLTEEMGVREKNLFIYDACHGADMVGKTPFKGLPEGCGVMAKWGGFVAPTPVGLPWHDGKGSAKCVEAVAKGEADVIVNIAVSKGHFPDFGGFTQCMKNHMGTFNPRPHAHSEGGTDFLFAINKTPQILGKIDFKGKKITEPRQQLCLIDALWASEKGPMGNSSAQPNRLFMGVFAPVLDYQVARRFRRDTMGWRLHDPVLDRFLSEFGVTGSDLPEEGILDISKA